MGNKIGFVLKTFFLKVQVDERISVISGEKDKYQIEIEIKYLKKYAFSLI